MGLKHCIWMLVACGLAATRAYGETDRRQINSDTLTPNSQPMWVSQCFDFLSLPRLVLCAEHTSQRLCDVAEIVRCTTCISHRGKFEHAISAHG